MRGTQGTQQGPLAARSNLLPLARNHQNFSNSLGQPQVQAPRLFLPKAGPSPVTCTVSEIRLSSQEKRNADITAEAAVAPKLIASPACVRWETQSKLRTWT